MQVIDFKEQEGQIELIFRGEATIQNVAEIKELLLSLQSKGTNLVLNLDELSGVDVPFLQLLCSLHRTAACAGQQLKLTGSVDEEVLTVIDAAGYQRDKACALSKDENCLWMRR
jgi:anti-anti-sigma factor